MSSKTRNAEKRRQREANMYKSFCNGCNDEIGNDESWCDSCWETEQTRLDMVWVREQRLKSEKEQRQE